MTLKEIAKIQEVAVRHILEQSIYSENDIDDINVNSSQGRDNGYYHVYLTFSDEDDDLDDPNYVPNCHGCFVDENMNIVEYERFNS